jgi:hypothetical protein
LAWIRGGEHGGRLVRAERAPVAEHVHPPRVRGAGVQHRAADQVDVAARVAAELRRDDVRAQVGDLRGDLGREPDAARLVRDGEAVPGLALERGRALAQHLGDEAAQAGAEFGIGGPPGRGHGRGDAARLVRRAGHPGGELGAALAGEHQVSVRVHESGQHRPAARVHDHVGGGCPRGGPGPGHQAGVHDERRVAAGRERAGRVAGPVRGVRDELADVRDKRAHAAATRRCWCTVRSFPDCPPRTSSADPVVCTG